jgi:hypothetical protein
MLTNIERIQELRKHQSFSEKSLLSQLEIYSETKVMAWQLTVQRLNPIPLLG